MELISRLVASLGVSEEQAKGGVGLLLNLAQEKLGGSEFAQIVENMSGADDIMAAAPREGGGGLMGAVGGLVSSFGGAAGKLGGLASLAGGFEKLGLDAGMIGQFAPILLDFVRERGGDGVAGLLEKVVSGE